MELDMVRRFVEVCQEHHLRYWMMGGTLLGAVRHKGFIPWDNDIDLAMPRKDYNKLLEIGPDAFKSPLFFQTPVFTARLLRYEMEMELLPQERIMKAESTVVFSSMFFV